MAQQGNENMSTSTPGPGFARLSVDSVAENRSSASDTPPGAHIANQPEQQADESLSTSTSGFAPSSIASITQDMSAMEFNDPRRFVFPGPSQSLTPETAPSPIRASSPLPPTAILQAASLLPQLTRFNYLLTHTKVIVQLRGPYDTNGSGHLTCAPRSRTSLSEKQFAQDLAAVQDSVLTPQPSGPVLEDLKIFTLLWTTTVPVIEKILESNKLSPQTFGWGIYGITSGYLNPDPLFVNHRQRLHVALTNLPALESTANDKNLPPLKVIERMGNLTRARRSLHICATLLLQTLRNDWEKVRWATVIRVCEKWLAHLGWEGEDGRGREIEQMEPVILVEEWGQKDGLWAWRSGNGQEVSQRPHLHSRTISMG